MLIPVIFYRTRKLWNDIKPVSKIILPLTATLTVFLIWMKLFSVRIRKIPTRTEMNI